MFKFLKVVLLVIYVFGGKVWAVDLSDISIGFQSGYARLSSFNAISLGSGFPAAVNLQYQFNPFISTKFEYQWIYTAQAGGGSANLSSFIILPSYQFYKINQDQFQITGGFDYQYANFSGLDVVRHFEWSIGPSWSWKWSENWSLFSNILYTKSLNESFQYINLGIGVSYELGQHVHHENKFFSDHDHDGVPDDIDQCPKTPYGVSVSNIGCPIDSDGDSVADYLDFCPGTERGREIDDLGCPIMDVGRGVIDGIAFENDGPRLTDPSKNALIPVAENLKKFPNILFLIEGYAATSMVNQRMTISKARARSVMNILISYGVPAEKLRAIGLGNQYPLTDSNDVKDRILNERIEIKWKPLGTNKNMHASN